MAIKEIALADIRLDAGTQQRAQIDEVAFHQFAIRMKKGDVFPLMDVVFDGSNYWLVDGFHRYHAYSKNGTKIVEVEVSQGTKREAIYMSLTVNQKHGIRMKSEDVHKMLMKTVFPDDEWSKYSDEAIGEMIGYSRSYVQKKRLEYEKFTESQTKPEQEAPAEEETEPDAPTEPEVKEEEKPAVIDEKGRTVPTHLEKVFNGRPEIKEKIKVLSDMFKYIKEEQLKENLLYVNCKLDQMKADLGNFRRNLRFTLPYAVCPMCGGDVNNQECKTCDQHGFVNESVYMAIPDEMKGA
jgi:hypothetical protein